MELYKSPRNKTGYAGVRQRGSSFISYAWVDGKRTFLGTYKTAEEAAIAYAKAVDKTKET